MRLHELHINNFKFFPKQDPQSPLLEINGKNLLVYGENGSGKSTIYWAIYTLLESAFKNSNAEISKYFKRSSKHNLVNVFAESPHKASIKAVLKDGGGNSLNFIISNLPSEIEAARGDSDIRESAMASDFINYRAIFRLHHVRHSHENNLFPWFKDEILPYIQTAAGSFLNTYRNIENGPSQVPDLSGEDIYPYAGLKDHDRGEMRAYYVRFTEYRDKVNDWNRVFRNYLSTIEIRANEILTEEFNQKFEFSLKYSDAKHHISENNLGWEAPTIDLKIPKYNNKRDVVNVPHTFLNEAKWTAIGLSIRLAIIEDWTYRPNTAKLKCLIIDDMLISLDMSNRNTVLNLLIEKYVQDYQIIIMTHDRVFFSHAQKYIEDYYKEYARRNGVIDNEEIETEWEKHWKTLEMYEGELSNGMNVPVITNYKNNIQKAYEYLKVNIDYNSCGNCLRAAIEELFIKFLPENEISDLNREQRTLNPLLSKAKNYFNIKGFDITPLNKLERYRTRALNPSSHYNPKTNYFKSELLDIFKIVNELKLNKNFPILNSDDLLTFQIANTNGGVHLYKVKLLDSIRLYQKSDGSTSYYLDDDKRGYVMLEYVFQGNTPQSLGHEIRSYTLSELYNETVRHLEGTNSIVRETDMYEIFKDEDGNSLNSLKMY